jgi:multiple sugar transport system permease protein
LAKKTRIALAGAPVLNTIQFTLCYNARILATRDQTRPDSLPQSAVTAPAVVARRPRAQWFAYFYLLPAFIIIGVFHILPVAYALWISMQTGAVRRFQFAAFTNYARALDAPEFWSALQTTLFYSLGTVPLTMVLALGIAYLLFQRIRGKSIYRMIFFMPYVISTVASAIVWAWVFDPRTGLANHVLAVFNIPPQQWLIEPTGVFKLIGEAWNLALPAWAEGPSLALVAIMVFAVWQSLGFDVVLFLAGLSNINTELYEAARIDGANGWQVFRYITVPLLAPTTFFILVISIIFSLQAFNHIFAMNRSAAQPLGGPLGSTRTLSIFMFQALYEQNRAGYASAIAVLLSLMILAFTFIQFRILGRRTENA